MASTLPPEVQPIITYLTAPQLLGVMFNWGLWGILTVQVFVYYLCFQDKLSVRCLVYGLYTIECLQTALSTWDAFQWFSAGFGDLAVLNNPLASPYDSPVIDAIISLCVQLFFCWRIFVLSKSRIISAIIATISVAQAGAGIASGIKAGQIGDLSKLREFLIPELSVWLGGAALADVLIAITMTFLLLNQRTDMKSSDFIIKRIITLTIETNALSASVAIITLILFIAEPKYPLFICPPYVLGKLYTNTLLVIFNNRIAMTRGTRLRAASNQVDLRALQPSTNGSSGKVPTFTNRGHIEVSVTQDFGSSVINTTTDNLNEYSMDSKLDQKV
ncbi:hypothetical protein BDN72DRAFT_846517 [Pluteus cervinus]|uniref:Uncharacterized protein n=1 Tax=Pluteus cervinus TaxID=181527 RepID=A0ACD3AGM0_9AGAR|nr:hypothetical protein BDN72DRAFT_846517 [Pluteus cervinus]